MKRMKEDTWLKQCNGGLKRKLEKALKEIAELRRELSQSEMKYQRLFEGAHDAIFLLNTSGGHIEANKKASQLLGYTLEEFKGLSFKDIVVPSAVPDSRKKLKRILAGEDLPVYEKTFRTKDGKEIPVEISVSGIQSESGEVVYVQSIVRDITERKKAQEDLRSERDTFKALFDGLDRTGIGIIIVGTDYRISFQNGVIGGKYGNIIGKLCYEEYMNLKEPCNFCPITEVVRDNRVMSTEFTNPEGKSIKLISAPLSTSVTTVHKVVQVIIDLTEYKRMERALKESERRYRLLAENARDVIYRIQLLPILEFEYISPAVIEITGFTPEEHYSDPDLWFEIVHPKDKHQLMSMFQDELPFEEPVCLRWIHRDGKIIWTEQRNVPIYDGEGNLTHIEGISRDITESKKIERKLKEYSQELEKRVEERTKELRKAQQELIHKERLATLGRLSGSVAHELRNPLGAIANSKYFLNLKLKHDDSIIEKHLRIIEENIQKADKIISDLLDFSRERKVSLARSSVNDILEEMMNAEPISQTISIEMNLGKKVPEVYLDPYQILQAFSNIITNAVQAMPEGGKLKITTGTEDEFVFIRFADTGKGISEENLQKIFEPLFTTKARGIGLGLAIVDNIISNHGGRLKVTSKVGKGTEFIVKLPRKNED